MLDEHQKDLNPRAIPLEESFKNQKADKELHAPDKGYVFSYGTVIEANPGAYSYVVRTHDHPHLVCRAASDVSARMMGVKDVTIIPEETPVLVGRYKDSEDFGVILQTLPGQPHGEWGEGEPPVAFGWNAANWETGAGFHTETAYTGPILDELNNSKVLANYQRPMNTIAGDWGKVNEYGVAFTMLHAMATMRASERSKIDMFMFDDLVRIVSDQYQHFTSMGEYHVYNDGGSVTMEFAGSSHQPEVFGKDDYEDAFTEGERTEDWRNIELAPGVAEQDMKRRFQMYFGGMGDMLQFFLANPPPEDETRSNESVYQGLFHLGLEGSGRMMARSPSGFSLQRSDRIAVPKRIKAPWDPEGNKEEDEQNIVLKRPFAFDADHPYARNLQLRDELSYEAARNYQHFDALDKDYHVPESEDLQDLDDQYDRVRGSEENFSTSQGANSLFNLEADGSIVIRDTWGSEIVMRGGNIILAPAGDLMMQSGKSIVSMAGDDHIIRAKNSVDLSATDGDVRLKSQGNMHLHATTRGILMETDSINGSHGFENGGAGEDVQSSGITLKAEGSRVFLFGQVVHLSGALNIFLETVDRTQGHIIMSCGRLTAHATRILLSARDRAVLFLTQAAAFLSGGQAVMAGSTSASIFSGSRVFIPEELAEVDTNVAENLSNSVARSVALFYDSDTWLGTYGTQREDIQFTFRTAAQYGTLAGTEVQNAPAQFSLYQTAWQQLAESGYSFIELETGTWAEKEINNTAPWPGRENFDANTFYALSSEVNVDPETGLAKNRQEVQPNSGSIESRNLGEYTIIKPKGDLPSG
jgi:hypothetical protein